ncbi:MAG: PKD domain-containing protein [Halioglobus sp.]
MRRGKLEQTDIRDPDLLVMLSSVIDCIDNISNENQAPIANAGPEQTVDTGELVTLDGSASNDPDGDLITFSWSLSTAPIGSAATLNDATAIMPAFTIDLPGEYVWQLTVNDGSEDSGPAMVMVTTNNSRPVANAGPDQSVYITEKVHLDGSGSSDVDGDLLTYLWSFISRPDGSAATLSNSSAVNPTFSMDIAGDYGLQLIVNDGKEDSDPDLISVNTLNSAPVADAGPDQTVLVSDLVQLDGSGSGDVDSNPLSYLWSLTAKPAQSTANLDNPFIVDPAFAIDAPGLYSISLVVNDGDEDSAADIVLIATGNSRPIANAGDDQTGSVGDNITLDGSASSDADDDALSYQWSFTSLPESSSALLSGADTDQAGFTPDVDGIYVAQLIVSDSVLDSTPDTSTIEISVTSNVDTDGDGLTDTAEAELGTDPNQPDTDGDGLTDGAEVNVHGTNPLLTDTDGDGYSDSEEISNETNPLDETSAPSFPPDPADIAPPVDRTVATTVYASTEFLYTGPNPIQIGVEAGAIESVRAAVVRGRVLNASGEPLSGASIRIMGHPELGSTQSRSDGMFDMAVNGGGLLTVEFRRDGYLPAQRQVRTPWQDFVIAEDVALLQPDSSVTNVNLASLTEIEVARGNAVSDDRGVRTATIMFAPGTQATMTLPDGSTLPLATMSVRASEYTAGEQGPARMPGPLPPTSAYTYAVNLTVDEALAVGATKVSFSQPVPFYVDNFLGFPPGIQVPTAYYDSGKSAWIPVRDGRVIRILEIAGGLAALDTTGDEVADNGVALGISSEERATLAQTHAVGQTLWRVALNHFTPYDLNYGSVPPADAEPPLNLEAPPNDPEAPSSPSEPNSCPGNSVVDCQQQRLRETLDIAGTPYSLSYVSDRVPGYFGSRTVSIPLSGETVPDSLKSIRLTINVAGTTLEQDFPALPNQNTSFTWDGLNAFGQEVVGRVPASIGVDYVYDTFYALPPSNSNTSFGQTSGARIPGNIRAPELLLSQNTTVQLGTMSSTVGGWNITDHHVYNPNSGILHLGNGTTRKVANSQIIITTIAGQGEFGGNHGDGGPAKDSALYSPQGLAVGADGSLFIADTNNTRIRRISPDGIIDTVVGYGEPGFSGDGGPATEAKMWTPRALAVGPDNSLYFFDSSNYRIRRVTPDGIISTVVGDGTSSFSGDGGQANQAAIGAIVELAVGADGSLFISDSFNNRIRRVSPDGIINTVVGNGVRGFGGDGGPAVDANLSGPGSIVVGEDGSLYFIDNGKRIRRVSAAGIITTVAGNNSGGDGGDGGPALDAGLSGASGLAISTDASLFIGQSHYHRIRRISPDGIINTIAGNGSSGYRGDGGLAALAVVNYPLYVAADPGGSVYIADRDNSTVRKIHYPLPSYSPFTSELVFPSEEGSQYFVFDLEGRHLRTHNALTSAERLRFEYNQAGLLESIMDGDGNITLVERDTEGSPLAIVAPHGQRTNLVVNTIGFLESFTNPSGEQAQMYYSDGGLLVGFSNPRGQTSQYSYDELGRLLTATSSDLYSQSLTRSVSALGYQTDRSTALGRTTSYAVDFLPSGVERRTTTLPDGTATVLTADTGGGTTVNLPDGSIVERVTGPDPRFGMLAPVPVSTTTTNGSLVLTEETNRTAEYQDPADPSSLLVSFTETRAKNSRQSSRVFTVATKTYLDTTPAGRTRETVVDERGRIVRVKVPGLTDINVTYDSRGRLSTITKGSRSTSYAYNGDGNLSSITYPLNRVFQFTRDAVGRITSQTGPDGRVVSFSYDPNGNLTSLTPAGRPSHRYEYTAGDLEAAYIAPDLGDGLNMTTTEYNLDRATELITLAGGAVIDPAYDAAGRLSTLTIGRGEYSYEYDSTNGLISSVTSPDGGTVSYAYSGSLRLSELWGGAVSGSVDYTYDNDFRVASQSVNGADDVTFGYDADSLLTQAGDLTLTRDIHNELVKGTVIDSVTGAFAYNSFGELSSQVTTADGTDLFNATFLRDALGRIVEKREVVEGAATNYTYSYDLAGQLDEVWRDGTLVAGYDYDANGNRTALTTQFGTMIGTYDSQDRLLTFDAATYSYTRDGRLMTKVKAGQTTAYNYDELGNIISVVLPDGTKIEYLIDSKNRRVGRSMNGVTTHSWLYEGKLRPVAELDVDGNVVSRFVYGTRVNVPEYMIRGGAKYRFVTDNLGSLRLVVNTLSGQVVQRIHFDEFGNVIQDTNPGFQPFGFAGGMYDPSTQLTRFGARDFDPYIGRWTSKDPIGLAGGINLYAYVGNDPLNYADPFGLEWNPLAAEYPASPKTTGEEPAKDYSPSDDSNDFELKPNFFAGAYAAVEALLEIVTGAPVAALSAPITADVRPKDVANGLKRINDGSKENYDGETFFDRLEQLRQDGVKWNAKKKSGECQLKK